MADKQPPLLGLCPIGKFVFSHEDALRQKKLIEERLTAWGVRYVNIDTVVKDGLVRDAADVPKVVEHFRQQQIDAVFMPHCNFGTEHAVGLIGRELDVPVLVWGPRDDAPLPDGTRLRDTLCGLFASTKVLHKLGVPFSYIENCGMDDEAFRTGIDTFLRAANVAAALRRGIRIGLVGQRIDFFWTTIVNESDLLEKFRVEVLPLDMVEFIESVKARVAADATGYTRRLAELRERVVIEDFDSDEPMMNVLAVGDELLALREEHGIDSFACQTFMSIINALGAYTSFANSLAGDTVPIALESDIHGAVTNVLLSRATLGVEPPYSTEFTGRHPDNDDAVLLWHAGAPLSMCHPDETPRIGRHWILPSPLSGMPHFRLKDGPITVARFDGDHGEYRLAVGEGESTDGPKTLNNYVWMQVDDWPRWERLLMTGPFIHHCGMVYGHVGAALVEACRFVPGLSPVRLNSGEEA
jgi:L-fucose isomerase-like protein